ncbi:hypothetical protein E1091_02950 [Micromonospora fluostatini]|uniref:Transcriptional regulator n=1 Tax=Micromonospora fluostatini TaxID=1629071 RepID=A0ABY2DKP2_9ACTN|nr:hypothetical protein E1091_02950 [Micromonospora fluostatini]
MDLVVTLDCDGTTVRIPVEPDGEPRGVVHAYFQPMTVRLVSGVATTDSAPEPVDVAAVMRLVEQYGFLRASSAHLALTPEGQEMSKRRFGEAAELLDKIRAAVTR